MGINPKTRKRNLQKTIEENASVHNKISNLRILNTGRFTVSNLKTINKIVLFEKELIGDQNGSLASQAILVLSEFPGLTLRTVEHAFPNATITGPTSLIVTPETAVNYNFYYTWHLLEKKNELGEIESESLQFRGWINAKIDSSLPVYLNLSIVFYNRSFYGEIQTNKT